MRYMGDIRNAAIVTFKPITMNHAIAINAYMWGIPSQTFVGCECE